MKKCRVCDCDVKLRNGKYGEFYYCTSSKCTFTISLKKLNCEFHEYNNKSSHGHDFDGSWADGMQWEHPSY